MKTKRKPEPELGIGAVSRRTGLSQHLIRVWERRYGAVRPVRTDSNRRLYSEEDAVRLSLLSKAVRAGHRIGDIAGFPTDKLERLVGGAPPEGQSADSAAVGAPDYIARALTAISNFDPESLGEALLQADVDLGQARSLEQVIMPLMERIGVLWKEGEVRVAQEHMATAVVTHHVGSVLENFRFAPYAPVLVVATPIGQMHEAGALAAGLVAALEGWRPLYVGANLPADEIAGAARRTGAKAVALSVVYPADDPRMPAELSRLRHLLPNRLEIMVGGRAATAYVSSSGSGDFTYVSDLAVLRSRLNASREAT